MQYICKIIILVVIIATTLYIVDISSESHQVEILFLLEIAGLLSLFKQMKNGTIINIRKYHSKVRA